MEAWRPFAGEVDADRNGLDRFVGHRDERSRRRLVLKMRCGPRGRRVGQHARRQHGGAEDSHGYRTDSAPVHINHRRRVYSLRAAACQRSDMSRTQGNHERHETVERHEKELACNRPARGPRWRLSTEFRHYADVLIWTSHGDTETRLARRCAAPRRARYLRRPHVARAASARFAVSVVKRLLFRDFRAFVFFVV